MQLNGTEGIIMAASEPPEPPPRNPDKINASLKQTSETVIHRINTRSMCAPNPIVHLFRSFEIYLFTQQKSSKSLDVCDRQTNNGINNGKTLQSILSLDSNLLAKATMGTKPNDTTETLSPTGAAATVAPVNETTTTISKSPSTPTNNSAFNSPKADESNGKMVNSKSSSSSVSATSATKIVTENHSGVEAAVTDSVIGNNRNGNDTDTTSDANKRHESNDMKNTINSDAVSISGEQLKIWIPSRRSFNTFSLYSVAETNRNLNQENVRLQSEIARLKKLLANSPDGAVGGIELSDGGENGDDRLPNTKDANRLEIELRAAREQISSKIQ